MDYTILFLHWLHQTDLVMGNKLFLKDVIK